ncbi:MAG: porin [Pseudomonadota bacterium]|nr:porin [Pseudomonadota bacterium]
MIKFICAAVVASAVSSAAVADVTINGFASINAGATTGSNESLYGYDDKFELKNESLFAIQLQSDLGDKLSVTGQLLGRGADDFDVDFEWAFLSYELNDQTRVSAGRLRTPFFKYSDFLDVGYAYDWIRPPQSVYGLGFANIEGVSLYRTDQLGRMDSSLQFVLGNYDSTTSFSGTEIDAQIDSIVGATWELTQGSLSGRVAYLVGETTFETAPVQLAPGVTLGGLFSTLEQFGLSALVADLAIQEDDSSFLGFGVTYDNGDWIIVSEITNIEVDNSFIAEQDSYYLSVGHRFGSFTPYISYEKDDNTAQVDAYSAYQSTLPAQLFVPVKGLVDSQAADNDTWNLGFRYDFHPSAAFKAQFTDQDNQLTGDRRSLISVGIDLVF